MRIIAGRLGGRTFETPKGHKTHPMSEKMRGALFNILGDVTGLTIFDAFAGSGAVAIEAISRGAKSAVATDITKEAHEAMKQTVEQLGIEDEIKVVRANASGWSDNNPKALFDLVVVDPPYDDTQMVLLNKLTKHVKKGGLYVASLPPKTMFTPVYFKEVSIKDYGDASLRIYRRI